MYKISQDIIIVNLKFGPDFSFILFMFFLYSSSLCPYVVSELCVTWLHNTVSHWN